jgi:hypothetical protein
MSLANDTFISYRRSVSAFVARAVFLELRSRDINVGSLNTGYDVVLSRLSAHALFGGGTQVISSRLNPFIVACVMAGAARRQCTLPRPE